MSTLFTPQESKTFLGISATKLPPALTLGASQVFFIVNPVAGRGKGQKVWKLVEGWLKDQGIKDYGVRYTTARGAGTAEAVAACRAGWRKLVVVGGDGTLHEVINGMDLDQSVLGLIPAGTGNDFARTVGIPLAPLAAARVALAGEARWIDLGRVAGCYFINVAGVGFDAQIAREINQNFRFLSGTTAYLAALVKVLATYRNVPVTLDLDGKKFDERVLLVAVGNGQYVGGGMRIVPDARVDDGIFHLCVAGDATRWETLTTLPRIFRGTHVNHPKVASYTARMITVTSRVPMPVHADGEVIGETPVTFQVTQGAVRVSVPSAGNA